MVSTGVDVKSETKRNKKSASSKDKTQPETTPNATHKGRSPWNALSITYNSIGILIGVAIFALGCDRSYALIDSIWFSYLGERKAIVTGQWSTPPSALEEHYKTTFQVRIHKTSKPKKVTIDHQSLYDYIKRNVPVTGDRKVEVMLVRKMLSRKLYFARVGRKRIAQKPKSAELIFYLGLIVMGGLVAFSALKSLRKSWLRRGIVLS